MRQRRFRLPAVPEAELAAAGDEGAAGGCAQAMVDEDIKRTTVTNVHFDIFSLSFQNLQPEISMTCARPISMPPRAGISTSECPASLLRGAMTTVRGTAIPLVFRVRRLRAGVKS